MVTVLAASDLANRDIRYLGQGSSDPYCEFFLVSKEKKERKHFETDTIDNTLNPVWKNEKPREMKGQSGHRKKHLGELRCTTACSMPSIYPATVPDSILLKGPREWKLLTFSAADVQAGASAACPFGSRNISLAPCLGLILVASFQAQCPLRVCLSFPRLAAGRPAKVPRLGLGRDGERESRTLRAGEHGA